MIPRDEIAEKSGAMGIHWSNVQRDYVFGWLLSGMYQISPLANSLVLKGGNALRKAYIPTTRFSDDLDFTTTGRLPGETLLAGLNEVCAWAEARSGIRFDLDRNRVVEWRPIDHEKEVYKLKLFFQDFSGNADHITISVGVDVTEFDRLYLPIQERPLIHPYSDADQCTAVLRCVKLEEALADKLKCLIQRRYCNDLFDLVYGVFIAEGLGVDRTQLVQVFLRKTIFGPSPIAAKQLLVGLAVHVLKLFWDRVVCPVTSRLSFDRAIELFKGGLEALFAPFGYGQEMAMAFFPAELRNPILQAGTEQRLLRIGYRGAVRMVEPYSLSFKRRQDGVAQEYLYGHDLTGGHHGPGLKSFVRFRVESLELTDEHFTPRFAIELAKAGEPPKVGFFTGNRAVRRPSIGG